MTEHIGKEIAEALNRGEDPTGLRMRVDYAVLQQLKTPIKTEVVEPKESEWEHMQRTKHQRYFYENLKGNGWVVTCVCGEQVIPRFPLLARYGLDKEAT